jgi:hypothetical protein
VIFSKPPTSVIGPGEAVEHNAELTQQRRYILYLKYNPTTLILPMEIDGHGQDGREAKARI